MVKLKYVVKIVAYIWSKPNIGQILYDQTSNSWSNENYGHFPHSYMVKHAANIWSKFKKVPLYNSHGYDVSIS